jgi:hypothetical protein
VIDASNIVGRIRRSVERTDPIWLWSVTVPLPGPPFGDGRPRIVLSAAKKKNGAVTSAVLGAPNAWIGPLRLALAGATRSGTAGVASPIAIR